MGFRAIKNLKISVENAEKFGYNININKQWWTNHRKERRENEGRQNNDRI